MLRAWYSIAGQSLLRGLDRPSGIIMSTSVLHKQRARWCLGFFLCASDSISIHDGSRGLIKGTNPAFFPFFLHQLDVCFPVMQPRNSLSPPPVWTGGPRVEMRAWDGLTGPDKSGITPSDVFPSRSPHVHIVQITAQFDCNHALNMELVWRGAFLIMGNL